MKIATLLDGDVFTTAYQRERCRTRLAELRLARGRALDSLFEMCRDLQKNSDSLDPERMSYVVAEIRYLEGRAEQLEKFLLLTGPLGEDGNDA